MRKVNVIKKKKKKKKKAAFMRCTFDGINFFDKVAPSIPSI